MSTCPYCLGPLTESHQCPKRRQGRMLLRIGSILSGGAAGFVAMALLDPEQRSTHLDLWVIFGGALLGALVYEALAPRR